MQLSTQNSENIRRQLNLEDERVRRGSGIAVDVLQAKSRLQIALERLSAVSGALQDAQSRYLQVFGKGAEPGAMTAPSRPAQLLPASLDDAINAALDENPQVLSSYRQIDLAAERRDGIDAEYQPTVDLVLLHKRESDFNATPGTRKDYTAKVQATWNMFNGLGTTNRSAAAAFDYEARLGLLDRGFVHVGQKAQVKIDTYDYSRYGAIDGEVISVAPDSTIPENGLPYLKVVVRTDRAFVGEESAGRLIAPGMGATVDIHTGSKTVLSYLMKPVLKLKNEAFRER